MVPANKKASLLEGGNTMKLGSMLTLKHDISSPEFYELLIKTELKDDTALDLKNFYNHIKICLNAVTRLREDLLPDHRYTLILNNTLSQIVITLPILVILRPNIPLDAHCWWH